MPDGAPPRRRIAPLSNAPRTDYVQHLYTVTPDSPPPNNVLTVGEIGIELADPAKIWVGVPTSMDTTGRKLLYDADTIFSVSVADSSPDITASKQGDLWWDSTGAQLYIAFDDGSSKQWVPASNLPIPSTGTGGGGGGGSFPEAPTDGQVYGRQGASAAWVPVLPLDNGLFDGGNF